MKLFSKIFKSTLLMGALIVFGSDASVPELLRDPQPVNSANNEIHTADQWESVKLLGASTISSIGVYYGIGSLFSLALRSYTNAYQNTCAEWSGCFARLTCVAALAGGCSLTSVIQLPSGNKSKKYAWAGIIASTLVGTASATAYLYGKSKPL